MSGYLLAVTPNGVDRHILKTIELPGQDDTIVLREAKFNRLDARSDQNLVRLSADGDLVWAAQRPPLTLSVEARLEGG
jgi:hypothetical protein